VARLERRLGLPAWNLGVGGIRIEPGAFSWALESRRWELVTVALGGNHAWREADAGLVGERAAALADLLTAGGHGRVLWLLPGWKPCEEGLGPPDFQGVPLDRAAGMRMGMIRETLHRVLAGRPGLELAEDLLPRELRWYPDGLHPQAAGFARMAEAVAARLGAPAVRSLP
jgi:lysophospholipase L1-like esterase